MRDVCFPAGFDPGESLAEIWFAIRFRIDHHKVSNIVKIAKEEAL